MTDRERDDGFAIADVDTGLWSDPKVKRLVRQLHDETASLVALALFHALLLESWGAGERLTLDEAAPAWSTADLGPVAAALVASGLVDDEHRIPTASWDRWFGPARDRREQRRISGSIGGTRSWVKRRSSAAISDAEATPEVSRTRPSDRPTDRAPRAPARQGAREEPASDPRPLADILGPLGLSDEITRRRS